jgi:hypothetical protein
LFTVNESKNNNLKALKYRSHSNDFSTTGNRKEQTLLRQGMKLDASMAVLL